MKPKYKLGDGSKEFLIGYTIMAIFCGIISIFIILRHI